MNATKSSLRGVVRCLVVGTTAALIGCGEPGAETADSLPPPSAPQAPPPVDAPGDVAYVPPRTAKKRSQARVGSSKKGRARLPAYASTLVSVQERAIFGISIPHAMRLHTTQSGKIKNHEEFMTKIIERNNLKLPELPEGAKYVFDVERQVLMIEE